MKTIAHGGNLRASCGREFRGRPAPGDGARRVPAAHSWFPRSCPRMSPAASTAPPAGVGVPISRAAPQDPALAPAARRSETSGNAFPGRPGAGRARSPGQGPRGPGVGWGRVSARHGFLSGRTAGRQDAGRRRLLPGLAPARRSRARPPDGAERGRGSQCRGRWRTVAPRRGGGRAGLAAPGQQHRARGGRRPRGRRRASPWGPPCRDACPCVSAGR